MRIVSDKNSNKRLNNFKLKRNNEKKRGKNYLWLGFIIQVFVLGCMTEKRFPLFKCDSVAREQKACVIRQRVF